MFKHPSFLRFADLIVVIWNATTQKKSNYLYQVEERILFLEENRFLCAKESVKKICRDRIYTICISIDADLWSRVPRWNYQGCIKFLTLPLERGLLSSLLGKKFKFRRREKSIMAVHWRRLNCEKRGKVEAISSFQ